MMAKMFYTADETRQLLGKDEEELKQLTRENRLREFRDGGRVLYKADQVDALRAEMGGGDQIDLGPSDTGSGLAIDAPSGTSGGSVISLADSSSKEDTATDLGLSPVGLSGTGSGINVLGDEGSDPSAQTSVTQSSGLSEQFNVESMGSGSGLLDLSRERDDTSLGMPVMESGSGAGLSASGLSDVSGAGMPSASMSVGRGGAPVYIVAPDPIGTGLGAAAFAAALVVLIVGILAIAGAVTGTTTFLSDLLNPSNNGVPGEGTPWFYIFGGGALAALICFVIGMVLGKKR